MFSKSTVQMSEGEEASAEVTGDSVPEVVVSQSRTLRVNGKDVVVNEDQFDKYLQLGLASTEKFTEAKRMQEEAQKIIGAAKDQKSALKALEIAGHTRAEAREILENELRAMYEQEEEDAKLSPEAKTLREREAELAEYKKQEADRKQKIADEANSKEESEYLHKIDNEIADAIEASDLPKYPIIGKMALNYMSSYANQGQELSAKEAMKYVAADVKMIFREMLSEMDAKTVKQHLKEDQVKGLRDEALSEYQSKQKPFDKPATVSKQVREEPKDAVSNPVIRSKDFFNPFK